MKNGFPQIIALDTPAAMDCFGLANTPIGFIVAGWQDDLLVLLKILPAEAEKDAQDKPKSFCKEYAIPAHATRDDARAKKLANEDLFPQGHWTGHFPSVRVGFHGTDFQTAIMRAMNKIPSGRTLSYGALAEKAGQKGAARAAGSVCANNPIPLVVPCHRVVTASGALGSYGYGTGMKRQLLYWEDKTRNPY